MASENECFLILLHFSKSGNKSNKNKGIESVRLGLKMNEENIPHDWNPRFLEVILNY